MGGRESRLVRAADQQYLAGPESQHFSVGSLETSGALRATLKFSTRSQNCTKNSLKILCLLPISEIFFKSPNNYERLGFLSFFRLQIVAYISEENGFIKWARSPTKRVRQLHRVWMEAAEEPNQGAEDLRHLQAGEVLQPGVPEGALAPRPQAHVSWAHPMLYKKKQRFCYTGS